MPTDYERYIEAIGTMLVLDQDDANFARVLPSAIAYAEGRIYRELDLLSTTTADASQACAAGSRFLALPSNPRFVIVQGINIITPAGSAPDAGTRNPLIPVTKEMLDMCWPSAAGASVPTSFAMFTDQSILVGPWPDASYKVEVVGTVRPAPLSPNNASTFLTLYLWDLFLAASMVFGAGYQKNFGAQADDPKAAQSWENQYQALFSSANAEELRRKWSAGAGTSSSQPIVARSDKAA